MGCVETHFFLLVYFLLCCKTTFTAFLVICLNFAIYLQYTFYYFLASKKYPLFSILPMYWIWKGSTIQITQINSLGWSTGRKVKGTQCVEWSIFSWCMNVKFPWNWISIYFYHIWMLSSLEIEHQYKDGSYVLGETILKWSNSECQISFNTENLGEEAMSKKSRQHRKIHILK